MEPDMNLPGHIGIIMDGNRRWARKRGLPDNLGHREGYKRFLEIGELCRAKGIKTLTVYALSTENFKKRDEKELKGLMDLMRKGIVDKADDLHKENIKIRIIGRKEDLPEDLRKDLEASEEKTKNNTGAALNIAVSYGSRAEIVDAVKGIIASKVPADEITEETVSDHLYTSGQDDPDLIIRTGGASRLSNFLLWQSAYAEIYLTDILWPDFTSNELDKALSFFANIKRNFGE